MPLQKKKKDKMQTTFYKTLHIKPQTEQHEHQQKKKKTGMISGALDA